MQDSFRRQPARRGIMRWCCRSRARTARASASLGAAQQAVVERARPPALRGRGVERVRAVRRRQRHACGGCSSSAPATATPPSEAAEKLGGTAVARLLTSGEKKAVIDLSGLGYDADAAARVGLAAALRSWRYDRYRTKLKDKQKPTLDEVVIVGGGEGAAKRYAQRWAPVVRRRVADPRAGHRAGQHHLSRDASSSASAPRSRAAASRSRCSTARRWRSSAWARCSASPRARSAKRGC